ncbi:EAL domain-containing protein [Shewanella algae]
MFSKFSLKHKLLLYALVPILVLCLLGCIRILELYQNYQLATKSRYVVEISRSLSNLLYEVQQERGLTSAYISCRGNCFNEELTKQQHKVSALINELNQSPYISQLAEELSHDPDAIQKLLKALDMLDERTEQLELNRNCLLSQAQSISLNFYSEFNDELLLGIVNLESLAGDVQQAMAYADLTALLRLQELAVRERELANRLLTQRRFSTQSYEQLANLQTEQAQSLELYQSIALENHKLSLELLLNNEESQELSKIREQLRRQDLISREVEHFSALIGYDGLQHEFKNFLYRGDEHYRIDFYDKLTPLKQILAKLRQMPFLNSTQQQAIDTLDNKLKEYAQKMLLVTELRASGVKTSTIDQQVQLSDEAIHAALRTLSEPSPPVPAEVWWRLASKRIQQMDAMAENITDDILAMSSQQLNHSLKLIGLYLVCSIITVVILMWIGQALSQNLLKRIYAIRDNMHLMAKDPNLNLAIHVEGKDELADMAQALSQMLNERQKSHQQLKQAAAVFDYSGEGIVITDADNHIELINPAFTRITGYRLEEVQGRSPSVLNSHRHDKTFFNSMWDTLLTHNKWEGEIWNKRKNGEIYPEFLAITLVRDDNNNILKHIGLFVDISHRKKYEQDIWYQSHFDALTRLPNRKMFNERLHHELLQARLHGHRVATLLIDLDRFKYINDALGHKHGDLLLQQVARRLESLPDKQLFIARIGGDEFAVILPHGKNDIDLSAIADRVKALFNGAFDLDGKETLISVSFGIGVYPEDGEDIDALARNTETAMYSAKDDGRDNYKYFTPAMNASMLERLQLEQRLRQAVQRQEFKLHYQPIVSMETGKITSVEALLRWHDPDYGWISPERFIPIAESTGLIEPIGEWVLEQALTDLNRWQAKGIRLEVAINVSSRQCINARGESFDILVAEAIKRHGIEPEKLHIEITESMLLDDNPNSLEILSSIRSQGITIYMDDFGTGFSSLSYLRKFPISVIKIDKSFVDNALNNEADANLVRAIVMMGKSLELQLVAEGIETQAQWLLLKSMGCDYGQGYFMSRPLPFDALTQLLLEGDIFSKRLTATREEPH